MATITTTAASQPPIHTNGQFTPWPSPDKNGITHLQPAAYHSHQLLQHAASPTETPTQLRARHSFLGDYLPASPETSTLPGATAFLRRAMADLDTYFFCGALTRIPSSPSSSSDDELPLITLRLDECPPYSSSRVRAHTARAIAGRWVVRVYRSPRGAGPATRYAKADLVRALLAEMVHVHLQTFFCRCAGDRAGPGALDVEEGRGALYRNVLTRVMGAVRAWQRRAYGEGRLPLARWDRGLGVEGPEGLDRRTVAERVEDWYLSWRMMTGAGLRRQWAWFQNRPPGAGQVSGQVASLERVVVRLKYPQYVDYVRARVVPWREAMWTAVRWLGMLLCLVVFMAWWRVRGWEVGYMSSQYQATSEVSAADMVKLTKLSPNEVG
ncbi:hypothetical protein F4810DRAFT_710105 [Camillea tinctor]|nr:hypothetical protein F4810DRAFT_710105 [Camillea tinctor]